MMRRIHRLIGLSLAAVILMLAVTGLALHFPNQSRRLLGEPALPHALADPTTALAVDPSSASHIFLGTQRGLFESRDGGATWRDVPLSVPTKDVVAVAFAPGPAGGASGAPRAILVALANAGIFVSTDGGRVWDDARLPQAAVGERIQTAAFAADGEIVVRTGGGLYTGRAGGAWRLGTRRDASAARLRYIDRLHEGVWPGRIVALLEEVAAVGLIALIVTGIGMALPRRNKRLPRA